MNIIIIMNETFHDAKNTLSPKINVFKFGS